MEKVIRNNPIPLGYGITTYISGDAITLRGIPTSADVLGISDIIDLEKQVNWVRSTNSYTYREVNEYQYGEIISSVKSYFKEQYDDMYNYSSDESIEEIIPLTEEQKRKKDSIQKGRAKEKCFLKFVAKYPIVISEYDIEVECDSLGITLYNFPYSAKKIGLIASLSCYDLRTKTHTFFDMDTDTYISVITALADQEGDNIDDFEISSEEGLLDYDSDYILE